MALAVGILALAVFLSGAVAGVLGMLVIGIRRGDRAHHLADEPATHWMPSPAACWALACAAIAPHATVTPKEHDQCMLLTEVIAPCQEKQGMTVAARRAVTWENGQ